MILSVRPYILTPKLLNIVARSLKSRISESEWASVARQRLVKTSFRGNTCITDITTEMKPRTSAVPAVTNKLVTVASKTQNRALEQGIS
jgi:hypothetical protein